MANQQVYLELPSGEVAPAPKDSVITDGPRDGRWQRAIEVNGVLYHHVSETADGNWVYRKAYTA
jgi:hypothetical protein